ncbi:MAG: Flp pilus assembly complex ATPase component TadA [Verrucomicrobiales bacterium]|nr:Flp pilus assembly complex ATPase component TadA [Verrucomicrobiales bacterium]MCP5526172.1 Flp pilus assembly complex ATPase component TadA [Verrucomicrobiales bacterium]
MAARDDYLIDGLLEMGYVTEEQLQPIRAEADSTGEGVVDTLVAQGVLSPAIVGQAKAAHFGAEFVDFDDVQLTDEVLALIPRHIAKRFNVVPVRQEDEAIVVAMADPSDLDTLDGLGAALNAQVTPAVATEEAIEAAIARCYGVKDDSVSKMIQDITEGEVDIGTIQALQTDDGSTVEADAPIIKLVNTMIVEAFKMRASDIHLEPLANAFRLRYRIDGVLHEVNSPPKRLQPSVISRLKIQSNMSIAERRIPQDGRIQSEVGGKTIDLRVSCLPTTHGESIVMRILDKEGLKLGLPELGFFTDDQQIFERLIGLPDGILLVTGPTGSGKTTTLYAVLNYINRPDRKIITVEDPVEYVMSGINQVHVSETVGLTFAAALRAMLRQAPNVIMLGEIRDLETATIAINASLTGHLVFSTLHTNDAPSAVTRLIDIGVKPFLVASASRALMAQRLVRKICKRCTAAYTPTDAEMKALRFDAAQLAEANFRKGRGCADCNKTGYRGRMGIFEIFVIDDDVRKLIYEKVTASVLRSRAREIGMRTLREDGARKALAGQTTPDEVIQATVMDEN